MAAYMKMHVQGKTLVNLQSFVPTANIATVYKVQVFITLCISLFSTLTLCFLEC